MAPSPGVMTPRPVITRKDVTFLVALWLWGLSFVSFGIYRLFFDGGRLFTRESVVDLILVSAGIAGTYAAAGISVFWIWEYVRWSRNVNG